MMQEEFASEEQDTQESILSELRFPGLALGIFNAENLQDSKTSQRVKYL